VAALKEAGAEGVDEAGMAAMAAEPATPKKGKKKKGCVAWIAEQNNKGYYMDRGDELGQNLLHIAILEDAGREVVAGLVERQVDVNHVDKKGQSGLYLASSLGLIEYIDQLVASAAFMDVVTREGAKHTHKIRLSDDIVAPSLLGFSFNYIIIT